MDDKLQEKFALVQQMKREKELKEARAKESQPFDIFSIAGVNLPTGNGSMGGTLNMTVRHDGHSTTAGPNIGSVKRPRRDKPTPSYTAENSSDSKVIVDNTTAESSSKPKLKRSSMAARADSTQVFSATSIAEGSPADTTAIAVDTSERSSSPSSATPPTPIPSPKNSSAANNNNNSDDNSNNNSGDEITSTTFNRRNSGESSLTKTLAKDMTHNVQSRSGSVDENEEMVVDMFGRSVPRSRHHSSDEGSDSENEAAHPRRRRRTRHEEDLDRYRPSYQRSGRYGSRSRSRSRSRSPPRRYRRSRSRSVSPSYSHGRDAGDRRRRGHRDGRDPYSGDEMTTAKPTAEELDPYAAASRYLDTAFYPTKIYVGNLPSSISLTGLRTLFAPFGDIEDMNLVEGKDFGFVTYAAPIGAQEALAKMNGAMIDGTLIRVNRAKIPERNRRGFAGVAWMDEDGELARQEEEQHQQAAAITGGFLGPATVASDLGRDLSSPSRGGDRHRRPSIGSGGMATSGHATHHGHHQSHQRGHSTSSSRAVSPTPVAPQRPAHQLPARPRSPKLPPKPTGAASFPPAGMDPRAVMAASGRGGRQILRYDDLLYSIQSRTDTTEMVHKRESFLERHKDTIRTLSLVLTRSNHETVPRWKVVAACEKLDTLTVSAGRIRPEDWYDCWSCWTRLRYLDLRSVRFQQPVLVAENDANLASGGATGLDMGVQGISLNNSGTNSGDSENSGDAESSSRNSLSQEIHGPIVWDWPDFNVLAPATRLRYLAMVALNGLSVAHQFSILQRCPRIEKLRWSLLKPAQEQIPLREMTESIHQGTWPNLVELNLMGGITDDDAIARMLEAFDQGLEQLILISSGFGSASLDALLKPRHFGQGGVGFSNQASGYSVISAWGTSRPSHALSLTVLELSGCPLMTSSMAQEIMCSCPNLTVLRVIKLSDEDILGGRAKEHDVEDESSRVLPLKGKPWVCIKLERLLLSRFEMSMTPLSSSPLIGLQSAGATSTTTEVSAVSPNNRLILDRLSQLTRLTQLSLGGGYDEYGSTVAEPGRTLVLSMNHGLEMLARLKDMRTLTFDGRKQTAMGEKDVRWMAAYWPKLSSLAGSIPIDVEAKKELEQWLEKRGVVWYFQT
ncbi:hypothetical protein BGZ83_003308 [Gryganskiella cystojenkinii]|nr:hypothetical protein BGZ83_003308 [Gryganskiella cystojenkinii]